MLKEAGGGCALPAVGKQNGSVTGNRRKSHPGKQAGALTGDRWPSLTLVRRVMLGVL